MKEEPSTTAAAVKSLGRKRTAPASMTASCKLSPSRHRTSMEIDKDDRAAHDDAGTGD